MENNLSLYEISTAFQSMVLADDITDEDKVVIKEKLTEMLHQKSNNIIGFEKNIELLIESMKVEEERIKANRKSLENKLARFKDYVKSCMESMNTTKIETSVGTLSIAKNPLSIEILNEDAVPNKYKKEVVEIKIDKKAIADDFKSTGEMLDGVKYNTSNTSLRIK